MHLTTRADTYVSAQRFTFATAYTSCNIMPGRRTLASIFQPASMNLGPTTASHNFRGPAPESKEHILHDDDDWSVAFPMGLALPLFGAAAVLLRGLFAAIPERCVRHGWRRVLHTSSASSRRPTRRSRSTLEIQNTGVFWAELIRLFDVRT